MSLENLYRLKYPDYIGYKVHKIEPSTPRIYKGFTVIQPESNYDQETFEFDVNSNLESLHYDMTQNIRRAKEAEEEGKSFPLKSKLFLLSKEYVDKHGSLPTADSEEWLDMVLKAVEAKKKSKLEPKFEFDEDLQKVLEVLLLYAKHGYYAGRVYKRTLLQQFDLPKQKHAIEEFYESFGEYSKKQGNYATFDDVSEKQLKDFFEREVTGYKK